MENTSGSNGYRNSGCRNYPLMAPQFKPQKGGADSGDYHSVSRQITCDLDYCFACRKWFTKGTVERWTPRQGFPRLLGSARKHRDSEGQLQNEEARRQAPFFGARWRLGVKPECAQDLRRTGSLLSEALCNRPLPPRRRGFALPFEPNRTLDIGGRLAWRAEAFRNPRYRYRTS
jgi:hypothetical protein